MSYAVSNTNTVSIQFANQSTQVTWIDGIVFDFQGIITLTGTLSVNGSNSNSNLVLNYSNTSDIINQPFSINSR